MSDSLSACEVRTGQRMEFPEWRKKRCPYCLAGDPMAYRPDRPPTHNVSYYVETPSGPTSRRYDCVYCECEAPSEESYIAELEKRPTCGYCRDCKWWEKDIDESFGECTRQTEAEYGSAKMWSMPPDGRIVTVPDFGCVQFEGKENP